MSPVVAAAGGWLAWLVGSLVVIAVIVRIGGREEVSNGGLISSSWVDGGVGIVDEVHTGALKVVDDRARDEDCGQVRAELRDQVRYGIFEEVPVDVFGVEAIWVEYPEVCV